VNNFKSYLSNPIYLLAAISLLFLLMEWRALMHAPEEAGIDYSIYYRAATAYTSDPAALYKGIGPGFDQYLYPPPSIVIFLGLNLLPIGASYVLFCMLMYLCLIVALMLWKRLSNEAGFTISPAEHTAFAIFAIATAPVYHNISLGQINSLVVLLSLLFLLLMRTRPVLAGLMLALAIWIKVYPVFLLLLALLSREGRKSILGCAAGGILVPLLLLPIVSIDRYMDFIAKLQEVSQYASAHIINQSVAAFGLRLTVPAERWYTFPNMYIIPGWLKLLNFSVLGIAAGLSTWIAWKRNKPAETQLVLGTMMLSLSAVCSPLGWGHTYIFALPLVLVTWKIWQPRLQGSIVGYAVLLLAGLILLIPVYSRFSFLQSMPDILKNLYYSRLLLITIFATALTWIGLRNK
jgi:alpha-1,2-mannosyltransferase